MNFFAAEISDLALQELIISINQYIQDGASLSDNTTLLQQLNAIRNTLSSCVAADEHIDCLQAQAAEVPMVGHGPSMNGIWNMVHKVASADVSVLISGESGVGKELVANEIYKNSPRFGRPFVKINCASIPANLLESELFGYEKGAFSGANSKGKMGLIEAADGGTLLLDEIGEMSLELQSKLLRVLQSREMTRVGGINPIQVNFRIIASTNCNLKQKIKDGSFRLDLYHRLSVIPIYVPALRERPEDIPELCSYYLDYFRQLHGRQANLSRDNYAVLKQYSWPGNIRQLRNAMEYLTICHSDENGIDSLSLSALLSQDDEMREEDKAGAGLPDTCKLSEALEDYERQLIEHALARTHNMQRAGELLGIDQSTVSRKIKQLHITYH